MVDSNGLVLIVDDERDLRELVDYNLRQAGYRTMHAASGAEALERARTHAPQLIVLDLNLPDTSGTEVCRQLKADPKTHSTAVLMLTARGTETDRIVGLELGADDYVVKPFSVRELVLRVDAIRRRTAKPGSPLSASRRILRRGPIELDVEAFIARVDGEEIPLTLLEFRLLAYLIEGEGRVRTRDDLLSNVWNTSPEAETRTIDTHVKRIRDKLGAAGEVIETVRGLGYRIRQPTDD
jgi:two-component system phosphate regulon response regulator PhoB